MQIRRGVRVMHVEHFMTPNPIACDVSATAREAACLMRDHGVGCVVVLDHGKVAGLVTDRQLALHALADGPGGDTPVDECMVKHPATLGLEDNLFSAIDTMRSAGIVRRVPVVNDQNELLGIVSLSDISVIARDLVDAIMLEETHHALQEAHVQTGAKRIVREIRRPTKGDRRPPAPHPVTAPTPMRATGGASVDDAGDAGGPGRH